MISLLISAIAILPWTHAQQFVMYTPGGDDTSVERIDPIIAPGHIGQHVHQVFGSNALQPRVTYEMLQDANCTTVGDASGRGNANDRSIYWHPALYMEASNGTGYVKVPTNGHKLYYQDAGSPNDRKRSPFEFPHGFRMIAGDPFIRAASADLAQQNITQWICHSSGPPNQGTAGGFPNGVSNCDAYPGFNGAIHFPHCWNGNEFNQSEPTAHMSYPTGNIQEGECPASHPIRLPHIFVENQFNLNAVVDLVKPDTFVLAQGDNTGYGWHADFFNGWVDGAIPELFATCPQGEYGNEDIGLCPSFKPTTTSNNDCMLPRYYKENIQDPGTYLPGCNPIVDTNPAPNFVVAPLGISTNVCQVVGEGPAPTSTASHQSRPTPTISKTSTTKEASHTTDVPTPSASSEVNISCPVSDGKQYKATNGRKFVIQCGIDHAGGDLQSVDVESLEVCIEACASTAGCVDVSLSGVACYMKSQVGQRLKDSGVNGARLISSGKTKRAHLAKHAYSHLHRRGSGH